MFCAKFYFDQVIEGDGDPKATAEQLFNHLFQNDILEAG